MLSFQNDKEFVQKEFVLNSALENIAGQENSCHSWTFNKMKMNVEDLVSAMMLAT